MVTTTRTPTRRTAVRPEQVQAFKTGNEMAALAAKQVNYHVMGYFPITPSTEIAEFLDEMKAEGLHDIVMIPADGEHGAAGICYGAAVGGGRVLNATSANGLLYSIEQLPVQAGTRYPMVLNLVTRAISGPLDIRGDHSDLYFALNTGWIILLARNPQAVYDMNIIAPKIGEHPDVRLPVIVAYDGFFTSHQKRLVEHFKDDEVVQRFVGSPKTPIHALDPRHPVTIGPYMNDPDLINNKYQLKLAIDAAMRELPAIFAEYAELSGRLYPLVETYAMEDAEVALVLLNSAVGTAKDAADRLREKGLPVGVVSPNVLRPFPADGFREALRNVKVALIGDRADSFSGQGGNLSIEVKAALKDDPENRTLCLDRIYGLGGKDFRFEDAEALFNEALETARTGVVAVPYDYHGVTPGQEAGAGLYPYLPPLEKEEVYQNLVQVERDEATGKLSVKVPNPRELTRRPKRLAPGHGACPGCGMFSAIEQFMRGIEGDVVVLYQTGCAMVVTTGYPYSAHRVTYVHNLFQNGAATLSGLVEMYRERRRRGELPDVDDLTFVMITGDGGMDIGMGPAIGTALRNHPLIILEYDNEGYMNTGAQLSYSTPLGHASSTSHVGSHQQGKRFQHKDMPQIMAATNIPYVFTGIESLGRDLVEKAAKAQWYARNEGMVYGKMLVACPLNWRSEERLGQRIVQAAVDSCFFPLYEIEHGITNITYDPEARNKRVPVGEWLGMMGKTRHLLRPENAELLHQFEEEVERRWRRLKARNEHSLL
jgi:pyruvate ferredoxin oxidoreductase alpha subunit